MKTGDLVSYRRIDPIASFKVDHGRGVWVEDLGIVLSSRQQRPPRPDKDYFIRVFFPSRPEDPIRTLRASKVKAL